jgi:uncharacterized protein
MVQRLMQKKIMEQCFKGKAIILLGARQVGKTTVLKQIQKELNVPSIWLNADEGDIKNALEQANTSTQLLNLFGKNNKLVIIDEAQQIQNIGLKLKLIQDTYPEIQVIATGSSAFELQNEMNEPMTGRKWELKMYPISIQEMVNHHGLLQEKRMLQQRLIYGTYPEIINNAGNEKEALIELANSYLYKDILKLDGIRKSSVLEKLLQAIAMQIGGEVKYHEVAQKIGNIDPTTVEKYLDMLEKMYVIFKLPAFTRNLRNELKKGKKYYFYDNGIRNVLISNFNKIDMREDKGALWENFVIAERQKRNAYCGHHSNNYFWRTTDLAEIDYLEETGGVINAYEMKWKNQKVRFANSFQTAYPNNTLNVISTDDYDSFLLHE